MLFAFEKMRKQLLEFGKTLLKQIKQVRKTR